jgi:hypothetical protein
MCAAPRACDHPWQMGVAGETFLPRSPATGLGVKQQRLKKI